MFDEYAPYLPMELERLIFEMSSYDGNGTKHLVNLMLVAKYVHDWIKPILYETFLQSPKTKIPDIQRFPNLAVDTIGKFSKNLLFSEELSQFQVTFILSFFPNVENLAIWTNRGDLEGFQNSQAFQRLPLRRLSVFVTNLSSIDFSGAPFQTLTHLELIRPRKESWPSWEPLTILPRLTHILINSVIPAEISSNLLQMCPQLICLIQLVSIYVVDRWSPEERLELCSSENDHRLVSLSYCSTFHFISDWQNGLRGGMDNWTLAESITIARQRKYMTDSTPCWLPNDSSWMDALSKTGKEWYMSSDKTI